MKCYFFMLVLLVCSFNSNGEEILRSVEYSVSPDMTLNEARSHAIKQLRMTIISEVGVLVEAEIKSSSNDGGMSETVNYSNVLGGNISLKIIDEAYDGRSLFMFVRAEINKLEIIELLERIYNFTESQKLLKALEQKDDDIDVLASENKLLQAKLSIIKEQVRYVEKLGVKSKKVNSRLLEIKSNIVHAKKMSIDRMVTEDRKANAYIKLSKDLFTKGMLYSEFSDVIEVLDIREYYGNALDANCDYKNKNRNNLYMVTKKSFNYTEYIFGIEVELASKIITRIGFFKSKYEKSRSHCRVNYVGVSLKDIMPGNQGAAF